MLTLILSHPSLLPGAPEGRSAPSVAVKGAVLLGFASALDVIIFSSLCVRISRQELLIIEELKSRLSACFALGVAQGRGEEVTSFHTSQGRGLPL